MRNALIRLVALFAVAFVLVESAGPLRAEDALADEGLRHIRAIESAFRRAIDRTRPSMVSIFLIDRSAQQGRFTINRGLPAPNDPDSIALKMEAYDFSPSGIGSGIVVGAEGLVLTCHHVIDASIRERNQGRYRIVVRTHDGAVFDAVPHAADPRSDLAVLRMVSDRELALTPIAIGDGDRLFPGQFVLAMGNPYGTSAPDGALSASWGIVSNIRRRPAPSTLEPESRIHVWGTLVQTDARLNMGVSGGALIDVEGKLVGITMALSAATGFETPGGFALPTSDLTLRVIEALKSGKEFEYGFIGIVPKTITAERAKASELLPIAGVLVDALPDSNLPAYRAGLRKGDVITKINGQRITSQNELVVKVGGLPVGTVLDMEVVRGKSKLKLPVRLAKFPVRGRIFATNKRPSWNGLRVDHLSTLVPGRYMGMSRGSEPKGGVAVRDVDEDSQAFKLGLRPRQVVSAVNGEAVDNPDRFDELMAKAEPPIRLSINGGEDVVFEKADEPAAPEKANE